MPKRIHETVAAPLIEAPASTPGKLHIEVISPGWGSSGYYSGKVLDNAVAEKVWPAGTHVYLDHPTEADEYARPARTVKDLVGKLAEDARKDEAGRIVADVDVFGPFRPLVTDPAFAEAVGMSIRAYADSTIGEAEGRKGQIITRLVPDKLNSVDIVTHAGRGGRILAVLESAFAASESTINDQREALRVALDAAYGGEKSYVWIRDFDPDAATVWFTYENPTGSGTWQESYEIDGDGTVTLAGSPIEVRAKTVFVPVARGSTESATSDTPEATPTEGAPPTHVSAPAGSITTTTTEGATMATIEVEQAELTRLQAAEVSGRDSEARAVRAEARALAAENRMAADSVIREAVEASTTPVSFTALETRGLLSDLPVTTEGTLDATAYRAAVETAVAEKAKAGGAGAVRGFGRTEATTTNVTEADAERARASLFGRSVKEA